MRLYVIGIISSVFLVIYSFFFFQAEDGIRDLVRSRGLGDVYKRQTVTPVAQPRVHVRNLAAIVDLTLVKADLTADDIFHLSLIHI